MSRPSRKSVIVQTNARLTVQHGPDVVPVPSQATVYRRLRQLDRQVPTFDNSRQRNRDVAGRPNKEYGKLPANRPVEYLVMDSNRLDVVALDPVTLKWVCVELTVAMDWYTRCVTTLRLRPLSTKAMDVASLIFRKYRPNRAPDDWPRHAVWPEHGIPRVVFPDVDGLDGNKDGRRHPRDREQGAGPLRPPRLDPARRQKLADLRLRTAQHAGPLRAAQSGLGTKLVLRAARTRDRSRSGHTHGQPSAASGFCEFSAQSAGPAAVFRRTSPCARRRSGRGG